MTKDPVVHLSPVWKDKANFLIFAAIEGDDESLPRNLEQLWVRKVSDNEFEVCCIPFFIYGIALGDKVLTKTGHGKKYLFDSMSLRSERQVLRVYFEKTVDMKEKDRVLQELHTIGCLFEWYSENLLAVDSPNVNITMKLEEFFKGLEGQGLVKYELGDGA